MRTPNSTAASEPSLVRTIRMALLAVLVVGLVGVEAELFLLDHTEDPWQWTPIVLIGMALPVVGWHAIDQGPRSVRAVQLTMGLFLVAGLVGLVLHFRGNLEFERELVPDARGWALIWGALKGATPALAPGTMVQLGLIGLVSTFRHPATARAAARPGT
jgi:hypothetical protein